MRDEIVIGAPAGRVLYRLQQYLRSDGPADVARDTATDQNAALIRAGISLASKQVAIRTLPPVVTASGAEITMSWAATGSAQNLYPSLEAIISVEPVDEATTRIGIIGSYLPPLGDIGIVIDHVVGHRIATATLRYFLVRAERHVLDPAPEPFPSRPALRSRWSPRLGIDNEPLR